MDCNRYETRNPKYIVPKFGHEFILKSLNYNLINIINNTPSFVKYKTYTHSNQCFVLYIKHCILQTYKYECRIDAFYNCR